MAITKLARRPADDSTDTEGNIVNSTEVWILHLSTIPSSTVSAYSALDTQASGFGFPKKGSSHTDLSSLIMVSYDVSHYDSQKAIFLVTVNYTNDRDETEQNGSDDPLDVPTDYDYQQVDRQVVITLDAVTGLPLQNYANQPYLGVTENKPLTRITVARNERNYNNSEAEGFRNTVNKSSLRIDGYSYKAGTAKLELYVGSKKTDQEGNTYYTVRYSVLIDTERHTRKIPNRGTTNANGRPPNDLVKGSDGAANLDADGTFRDPAEEVIIDEWNTLIELNWSGLRL